MSEKIGEIIFNLVVPAIFTFIVTWTIAYFFSSSSVITVGNSIEIKENQFLTPININALKDINKVSISIPREKMAESQITSSSPININLIENNAGTNNRSVFEIAKVNSDTAVELMIETTTLINDKEILIVKNGNELDVRYSSDVINPLDEQKKSLIINAILYALIVWGLTYWSDRKRDKKIKQIKEDRDESFRVFEASKENLIASYEHTKQRNEQAAEESRKQLDELKTEIEKIKLDSKKHNILLLARLNDYRKELNFWRNTIRKVIYKLPKGEEKAEILIDSTISYLKTYQTHDKKTHDFETLRVFSNLIKDNEENTD